MSNLVQKLTQTSALKNWRKKTARTLVKALVGSLLVVAPIGVMTAPAAKATPSVGLAGTCSNSGLTVTATHAKLFYVDFSLTPKVNANYVGYRVANTSGARINNVWVKLRDFVGEGALRVTLADTSTGLNEVINIGTLNANETKTAFFFLKATSLSAITRINTTDIQSHNIDVFTTDPSGASPTQPISACTFGFKYVYDTIKAAANKVSSTTVSSQKPNLGETFTVTVNGDAGSIGDGSSVADEDGDVIWLNPAAYSVWPSKVARLVGTKFTPTSPLAGCPASYTDQLYISKAATCPGSSSGKSPYVAKYTFLVTGSATASADIPDPTKVPVVPIAEISSGTQIKHTDIAGSAFTTINLTASTSNMTLTKSVESSTAYSLSNYESQTIGGISYLHIPYKIIIRSDSTAYTTVDTIVDSPTVGALWDSVTAFLQFTNFTDANHLTSETTTATSLGNGKYQFSGPFVVNKDNPLTLKYVMLIPNTVGGSYSNSATGYVGSRSISGSSTVEILTNGTQTITKNIAPTITTNSPSSVSSTGAQLNGSFTIGSRETVTVSFVYGSDSSTVTSWTSVTSRATETETTRIETSLESGDTNTVLAGLTFAPGTKVYYKAVVIDGSGTAYYGALKYFTIGAPEVETLEADSLTARTAQLNGKITYSGAANWFFEWSDNSSLSPETFTATTSDTFTITGKNETATISGLKAATTYYFRIGINLSGETITGEILQFTTLSPEATTNAASGVTKTAATLNGLVLTGVESGTTGYETLWKFYWSSSADFTSDTHTAVESGTVTMSGTSKSASLSGLVACTKYYFYITATLDGYVSEGDILNFTTLCDSTPAPTPTSPRVNITWPTPGALTYPAPLGGPQLNAVATCDGAPVTGTYTYSPALGTILPPGTHTLNVTFTPDPGSGCRSTSTTVQIVVNAPVATITWPTPTPVQGPATLSPTQLNAICSVPGTLSYDPALGTILPAGTYTLKVTCTPTDPNIPPVSTTVIFNVVDKLPKVTWKNPEPMQGPATLSPTQLNATCSVAGKLTYDPALGTVYTEPGTYTLKVTCTPTDPKLPPVTTTVVLVILDVIKAPQNAMTSPITFTRGTISWDPVKSAVGYSVDIRGDVVCTTTTETSCTVPRTIGPKTPVIVTAIDKDKKTASARAVYFNDKLLTAIEVNFATSKFNIDAKAQKEVNRVSVIVKREGFTYVEITGHTDPRGGALNVALSKNRAKSLAAAMTKLVPGLTFKDAGLSYDEPKANNNSAAGMAKNRRSVGAVK